jgi:hypothetical protein
MIAPAWERRSQIGFFKAFFQTAWKVFFFPRVIFSSMKKTGGVGTPLFFSVVATVLNLPFIFFYQFQFSKSLSALGSQFEKALHTMASGSLMLGVLTTALVIIPCLFFIAGLQHLSLRILRTAHERFEATFRMFSYLQGVPFIFNIFFFLVGLLGVFLGWNMILVFCVGALTRSALWSALAFIGLKKVHHLSVGRTFLAMVLATVLLGIAMVPVSIVLLIVNVLKHLGH